MKNLRLALVALVAMGMFGGMDAYRRGGRGKCGKNECNVEKKSCKPCAPQCTEVCTPRIETRCGTKCIKVEVPVTYTRTCNDIKTTCVSETTRCEDGCWTPDNCEVKVLCNDKVIDEVKVQ